MKLLCLDASLRNNPEFDNFCEAASSILDIEVEKIHARPLERFQPSSFLYSDLSTAGFALEDYVLNGDPSYWSRNKPYIATLFAHGDYSTEKLEYLKNFQHTELLDLIMFQHRDVNKEHSWTFGDIPSMIKWSSSLFKIQQSWFTNRDKLPGTSSMNMAIWYAARIGLNVNSF